MHSARLLHYFEHPRHGGELPGAQARVALENPICGDQLVLAARVAEDGRLDVRFLARGCVAAMAVAEALCQRLQGHTVIEAGQLTRQQLVDEVEGLPAASGHAAVLCIEARDRLLEELRRGGSAS